MIQTIKLNEHLRAHTIEEGRLSGDARILGFAFVNGDLLMYVCDSNPDSGHWPARHLELYKLHEKFADNTKGYLGLAVHPVDGYVVTVWQRISN